MLPGLMEFSSPRISYLSKQCKVCVIPKRQRALYPLPVLPPLRLIAMAEMNTPSESGRLRGGPRSKKLSTRVDMTPMVDLGFLLITFFMLATVLTKPGAMPLVMPADGPPTPVGDSKALTLLIHDNDRISWYDGQGQDGQHPPVVYASNFSVHNGIGEVIRAKQQKVARATGDADQLVVMIKAAKSARYRSVVDALDEMKINRVARYAITDITPEELAMLGE